MIKIVLLVRKGKSFKTRIGEIFILFTKYQECSCHVVEINTQLNDKLHVCYSAKTGDLF